MIRYMTRPTATVNHCHMHPSARLWMLAALVLIAGRPVPAQPHPQTRGLRQQMIEAVQQKNEIILLDLISKPTGRQELLALSDDSVFEIGAAKMLAASLPQSPEVRKALRQTELSLLRQTDDESVVKELCLGLLVNEIREARDSSMALTAADSLYDDIHKDLNDVIRLREKEKVIQGEKLKTMLETADSLTKAVGDPARAFLKRISARASVSANQAAEAPAAEEPVSGAASAFKKTFPRESVWKLLLNLTGVLLLVLLVATTGWRLNQFRKG
jgi:hypothetical protein